MYRAVTHSIEVKVTPTYAEDQSSPENGRYFWAYAVEIVNKGPEAVQLRSRHWTITDGNGRVQEVHGDGVVGKQPIIQPGDSFSYSSGCPLTTPGGIMLGTYDLVTEGGRMLTVDIPAFSLDLPSQKRSLH